MEGEASAPTPSERGLDQLMEGDQSGIARDQDAAPDVWTGFAQYHAELVDLNGGSGLSHYRLSVSAKHRVCQPPLWHALVSHRASGGDRNSEEARYKSSLSKNVVLP